MGDILYFVREYINIKDTPPCQLISIKHMWTNYCWFYNLYIHICVRVPKIEIERERAKELFDKNECEAVEMKRLSLSEVVVFSVSAKCKAWDYFSHYEDKVKRFAYIVHITGDTWWHRWKDSHQIAVCQAKINRFSNVNRRFVSFILVFYLGYLLWLVWWQWDSQ